MGVGWFADERHVPGKLVLRISYSPGRSGLSQAR